MVDLTNLIETMVAAGFPKDESTNKVTAIFDKASELMAGQDESAIMAVVTVKVNEVARIAKDLDKYPAIVVGFTDRSDSNDFSKRKALEAYKEDPRKAIADGLVAIIDNEPVALDDRPFLDKAGKMKNGNYNKPLGVRMQREIIAVTKDDDGEDHITRCFGDYSADVGAIGTMFGTMKNGNLSMKGPGFMANETMDFGELYNVLNDIAPKSPLAVPITEIHDVAKNSLVIVKGFVTVAKPTSNDSMMIVLRDEDFLVEVVGFFNSEAPMASAGSVETGQEVIAIGRVGINKQSDADEKNISLVGLYINPETSGNADLMKQLDGVAF